MINPKKLAAYALVGTLLASSAFADDIRTLTATWDGSANGNSATAVATFDLDVTAINIKLNNNTGGNYYGGLSGYISNMTLTVSGASEGNGVFTDADYSGFYIQSTGPLDFSGDWVNQVNLYDFRLFASTGAPSAVNNKTLATSGGSGDVINLISGGTVAPVPEPSTLALAGIGGIAAFAINRRRK